MLTGLTPLALVIALSPLSIIPAVLVLHARRPRPTGLAFLGGWLLGLAAVTAVFVAASGVLGGVHKGPPTWASWLRVALGLVLILVGVIRWLTRHGKTEAPFWMRSFSKFTPVRAAVTGVVLVVVRPEVLIICAASGVAIGTSGLGLASWWMAVAFFTAVSGSTVAIPVLAYVGAGDRLDGPLTRLKDWMQRNNAALVAVVLVIIGLLVLYKGISAL